MSDDLKQVEIIIRPDPKSGGFVALCTEYPECVGRGKHRVQALQNVEAAISYHPDRLRKSGLAQGKQTNAR
ncbi:MAG: hypothetical protein KF821_09060 [Anaerolineales bacterium]|nr:hypothetical protein [Anaerolineales bacterium]